jgi:hypothetical protein
MRIRYRFFIVLFIITLLGCNGKGDLFIDYNNPNIKYEGRIDTSQIKGAEIYWSGTSIAINFEGESISALMADTYGDNYYNIILDEDSIRILRPDTIQKYHEIASGLSKGKHRLEIFKRTEWDRGKSTFYGFLIKGNAKVLKPSSPPDRRIEFYGNSITAAYAVEDYSRNDSPDSTFTNNYLSYAAIIARHYNAEYRCICRSGIGITVSWYPLIMPEMYDRLIPEDENSKWDFSLYTPDIVVVNLLQNDSWLVNMPEYDQFQARFGEEAPDEEFIINAYQQFISALRKHYPETNIICVLGNMDITEKDSKWPEIIYQAIANLKDDKIYTHIMPYKNTPGHPNIEEQQVMAQSLISFIDEYVVW